MTGIRSYDRRACFAHTDDVVCVTDYFGNRGTFIVERHESIAQHTVCYTRRVANGGIPAGQEVFAEWRFLTPARENRLFEIRPFIFAVRQGLIGEVTVGDGKLILPPTPLGLTGAPGPVAPDTTRIPAGVELKWRNPTGMARVGTDLPFPVTVDIIPPAPAPPAAVVTPNVGGVNGGFIEAVLTPYTDDISDLWKLAAVYGHTIEFGIANRTNVFWNPGAVIGGNTDNKQYFIGIIGRKYLLGECPENLARKVEEEEIEYKTVVVGGVPITTSRA
jgi:hypothetical protein